MEEIILHLLFLYLFLFFYTKELHVKQVAPLKEKKKKKQPSTIAMI